MEDVAALERGFRERLEGVSSCWVSIVSPISTAFS
jgi:hypothetical protein